MTSRSEIKVGRPVEYDDAEHEAKRIYMRAWYKKNKKRLHARQRELNRAKAEDPKEQKKERKRGREKFHRLGHRWKKMPKYRKVASGHIANALRDGKIKRKPCKVCGTKNNLEAHHADYSKPLVVVWYCRKHHKQAHWK